MKTNSFLFVRKAIALLVMFCLCLESTPLFVKASQFTAEEQNEQVYIEEGYTVSFSIDTVWNTGYNVSVVIQNTSNETIIDWFMYLTYTGDIPNMWNASVYEMSSNNYVLTNAVWNKDIYPNEAVSFGFTGSGNFPGFPEMIKITSGYDPTLFDNENDDISDDIDCEIDTDGDGLADVLEELIGSNPELIDSDGDELSDYQEFYLTLTDPTLVDSDDNGISDAYEDMDFDGLSNLEEFALGTDVGFGDSDRDDLNDYDEVYVYGTNPLNPDSDGEGLCDGDDVLLGFNPMLPDTNFDGILDCDEKVFQTVSKEFSFEEGNGITDVSVSLSLSGNISKEVGIINTYDFDVQSRELVGLIGVPLEIKCDVAFETAEICVHYDESMLGDVEEENLSLMWYDEENDWYQLLDAESVVDAEANTISYTTTHFSSYYVVDGPTWVETWISQYEDCQFDLSNNVYSGTPAEIDLFIISDTSYGMSQDQVEKVSQITESLINREIFPELNIIAKVKTENGIGRYFDGNSEFIRFSKEYYTNNGFLFANYDGMDHMLWTGRSVYLDSIFESMIYTTQKCPALYEDDYKVIVIISDGEFAINQDSIDNCRSEGFQIFTVDVVHNTVELSFKNISDFTGGRYYMGEIINDTANLADLIISDIRGSYDPNDGDRDDIPDYYEVHGMYCSNGRILYSDPTTAHSDTDGLSDGLEVGELHVEVKDVGLGNTLTVRYFTPHSDPQKDDSDGDGLKDTYDPEPFFVLLLENNLQSRYGFDYLSINGLNGGRQNWWYDKSPYPRTLDVNYWYFLNSYDYRIARCGCGLIAVTDLELFLAQQSGYDISNDYITINTNDPSGVIDFSEYQEYVEWNRAMKYTIDFSVEGVTVNVSPEEMSMWLPIVLNSTHNQYTNVRWAPSYNPDDTIKKIELMLSRNLPVILSCDMTFNDITHVDMYKETYQNRLSENGLSGDVLRAMNRDFSDDYGDEAIHSHYVTVIGCIKYIDDGINVKYILKVVSWGDIYYIRYDDFARGLSCTQNILEIY